MSSSGNMNTPSRTTSSQSSSAVQSSKTYRGIGTGQGAAATVTRRATSKSGVRPLRQAPRDTSNDPHIDPDPQIPSSRHRSPSESGKRRRRPILRGGSSTGGVNKDKAIEDDILFIVPAGNYSFDPSACIKRIGMECIGAYFKVGWTTMETCDPDAPDKWFQHFKTIVRWDPIYTHQIKANFRRKCSKIIADAWYNMRHRKSNGPKWATLDQKAWARQKFLNDEFLAARSVRNKINYRGEKSGRGPSKHVLGLKPITFHKLVLEKKLRRQVLPADMYRKAKKHKDGTFVTPDVVTKLKDLDDATEVVRSNHNSADVLPEGELMEAPGQLMELSIRSGLPNLYGATATLEPSSQWSFIQSTPSVTSHKPLERSVEEIVERVVKERIRPALSQIHERISHLQQLDTRLSRIEDTRLSRIEETYGTLADQMRMIIQLLQNKFGGPPSQVQHSQPPQPNP
ncbi:unnamed protein product [Rhodiola kirilowii]